VDTADRLKTPVNKILGNVQEVIDQTSSSELIYNSLTGTKRAAERCENIIYDLLSFTNNKNESFFQNININNIIEDSIKKAVQEANNTNIQIIKELKNKLPLIKADPVQLEQVFVILITNAYDALSEKLKTTDEKNGKITIASALKDDQVVMEISDTGIGIQKNILNKIFDPFFSTKGTSVRKGMGLTLAYNIIERTGGRIDLKSIPGSGTTFSIYLPVNKSIN
jgi:two-component system NtrC family sensor kinase